MTAGILTLNISSTETMFHACASKIPLAFWKFMGAFFFSNAAVSIDNEVFILSCELYLVCFRVLFY